MVDCHDYFPVSWGSIYAFQMMSQLVKQKMWIQTFRFLVDGGLMRPYVKSFWKILVFDCQLNVYGMVDYLQNGHYVISLIVAVVEGC